MRAVLAVCALAGCGPLVAVDEPPVPRIIVVIDESFDGVVDVSSGDRLDVVMTLEGDYADRCARMGGVLVGDRCEDVDF